MGCKQCTLFGRNCVSRAKGMKKAGPELSEACRQWKREKGLRGSSGGDQEKDFDRKG